MSTITRQNAERAKAADVMARETRADANEAVDAMESMRVFINEIKTWCDQAAWKGLIV